MADSDSDPFQSADEGENDAKNEKQKERKQPAGNDESPSTDKSSDHQGDDESDKIEAKPEPETQDEVENANTTEELKQTKEDNIQQKINDEKENVIDEKGTAEDSAEKTKSEMTKTSEVESDPSTQQDEKSAEKSEEKDESDRTEEPKAPEAQTIEGALDRLAVASSDGGGGDEGENMQNQASGGGGGWGSWGGWGSSLISSATSKVSQMGHGLSSVIENVESQLGVPKPEELPDTAEKTTDGGESKEEAKKDSQDEDQETQESVETSEEEKPAQSPSLGGWFSYGATALTSVVEKTVSGGLDALELIGKKTMDVLQEGDPGFRKKRDYISKKTGDSINLSQMLREAKESAETASKLEEEQREMEKVHFGILFDNYQGLAHLEALEMLSNESEMKVHSLLSTLSGDKLSAIQTEIEEIKDAFQVEDLESDELDESIDEQDFINLITEHLFGVCVAATPDKLQKVQKSAHEWLMECQKVQEDGEKKDAKELHIKAIETVAELSARSIEQFHKSAELMLLHQDKDQHKSHIQRATSLSKLTSTLCAELSSLAGKFCERLNVVANDESTENASESVNPIITNIYLEASNSSSYIQDAFQLLLPVLQALAVENGMEEPATEPEPTT
ncbi:protein FAM114A2-like [Amphiura filiformis]|uniref:protein FAM114A2-like n=1 Tax=Amphiura filiformis TaxID=82378 RepID=UPI003B213F61